MKKMHSVIHNGQMWTGDREAVAALEAMLQRDAERKLSIPREKVQAALQEVALCLRKHDGTDSSVQLKHFLWSLWNGHHHVNLYNLSRVLDSKNSDAVE